MKQVWNKYKNWYFITKKNQDKFQMSEKYYLYFIIFSKLKRVNLSS